MLRKTWKGGKPISKSNWDSKTYYEEELRTLSINAWSMIITIILLLDDNKENL